MFYEIVSKKDFEYFYKWISKDEQSIKDIDEGIYPNKYPCLVSFNLKYEYCSDFPDYFDFTIIYKNENNEWDLNIVKNWGQR